MSLGPAVLVLARALQCHCHSVAHAVGSNHICAAPGAGSFAAAPQALFEPPRFAGVPEKGLLFAGISDWSMSSPTSRKSPIFVHLSLMSLQVSQIRISPR